LSCRHTPKQIAARLLLMNPTQSMTKRTPHQSTPFNTQSKNRNPMTHRTHNASRLKTFALAGLASASFFQTAVSRASNNELEYAFGVSPSGTDSAVVNSSLDGGNFTMSWLQREAGDLDYFVRSSGNLLEWGPAPVSVENAPADGETPAGYVRKKFSVPASGRQFYRVLATDNPAAVPDQSFTISVAGTPVSVERWGTGPKAIVFFGYIPFTLKEDLKNNFAAQFEELLGSEYSMFLWTYPQNAAPYSGALSSLTSFFNNPPLTLANRIDFSGQASSVVQQIRASTGLTDICLVGNSFGAGVILWDFDTLASDTNLRFVLISPSELFMPFTPPTANPLPRTVLVIDAWNDFFIVSNAAYEYFEDRDTGPFPPGYVSGINYPHFIIGGDEFTTLEYVFDLIDRVYQQQ
jgi:hypothetical protein